MSFIYDLSTPSAVIDLNRLERNTLKMSTRAHQLGVDLRPHVKTHKTLQGAKYQVRDHFGGLTVSTLAEAEFYGAHGVRDITYAVPITPSKISRALELSRDIHQLNISGIRQSDFPGQTGRDQLTNEFAFCIQFGISLCNNEPAFVHG